MPKTIEYVSLAEASGYGLSAQCYMLALAGLGAEVLWLPLFDSPRGYTEVAKKDDLAYRARKLRNRHAGTGLFSLPARTRRECRGTARDVVVHHTVPELWDYLWDPRLPNVGCTVWETTVIPAHWNRLCERMERILVPSRLAEAAFRESQPAEKIRVVPHIARDIECSNSAGRYFRQQYGIRPDHYVFYTISDWNIRKSPWLTLNAYLQAFDHRDPVTLVIKTGSMGDRHYDSARRATTRELAEGIVANYPDAANVRLIDREIPGDDIDALHAAGDCYVALPHAEGWALGAFEAATAGKPVVITGWGGQLDYLPGDAAFLVDYSLAPVRNRRAPGSYSPNQQWAVPDLDDAIDKLRWIFANQAAARTPAEKRGRDIRRDFHQERIGRLFLDALPA